MARNLFAAVAVMAAVGSALAQVAPKEDKSLVTTTYDLKPVLGAKAVASGLADADAVVKLFLETLPDLRDLKPGTAGPQLVVRDGTKLEVRATAKTQDEVKDLLEALARLADVVVDIKAEVIEIPAGFWFDQNLKPMWKTASPIAAWSLAADALDANNSRVVQKSDGRFVNGAGTTVSSRQTVLTYYPNQGGVKPPAGPPEFVTEGFTLVGTPVVSADRRFVRLKLTEQSVAVVGMKQRELGAVGDQKIVVTSPDLADLGATGSVVVDDGGAVAFRLAYAPKDKVWVVVLRPTIFIQAEEDERKGKK